MNNTKILVVTNVQDDCILNGIKQYISKEHSDHLTLIDSPTDSLKFKLCPLIQTFESMRMISKIEEELNKILFLKKGNQIKFEFESEE